MAAADDIAVDVSGVVNRFGRQVVHDGLDMQVRRVAELADGVIVGSALVTRIARAGGGTAALDAAAEFVRELRAGIDVSAP